MTGTILPVAVDWRAWTLCALISGAVSQVSRNVLLVCLSSPFHLMYNQSLFVVLRLYQGVQGPRCVKSIFSVNHSLLLHSREAIWFHTSLPCDHLVSSISLIESTGHIYTPDLE